MAQKTKEVIVDANAFISLNWQEDPNHQKARIIFEKLKEENWLLWTNNYLVAEVISVLLLRLKNVKLAVNVGRVLYSPSKYIKVRQIPKVLQLESLEIFSQQIKPRLSFPDCTLIAQALNQKIKTAFSLDKNIRKFPLLKKSLQFLP